MLKYCSDKKFDKMIASLDIGTPSPEFDKYLDWIYKIAQDSVLHSSDWSAHNADFDAVAFPASVKFIGFPIYWGNSTLLPIPENATWLTIWKLCDELVKESGDEDHRFIETFDIDRDTVRVFFGS